MEKITTAEVAQILELPFSGKNKIITLQKIRRWRESGKIKSYGKIYGSETIEGFTGKYKTNTTLYDKEDILQFKEERESTKDNCKWFTVSEAIKELNISRSLIYKAIDKGELTAYWNASESQLFIRRNDINNFEENRKGTFHKPTKKRLKFIFEYLDVDISLSDWMKKYKDINKNTIYSWRYRRKFSYYIDPETQTVFVKEQSLIDYYNEQAALGKCPIYDFSNPSPIPKRKKKKQKKYSVFCWENSFNKS